MTPDDTARHSVGLTVIEILSALAIFGVVASGLVAHSVAVLHANRTSRNLSVATALAQDQIEQLRALDLTTNPPALTAGTHADPNNPMTPGGTRGGIFTRRWTVVRNSPGAGLATVTVQVSWRDGALWNVQLSTYVCQAALCT